MAKRRTAAGVGAGGRLARGAVVVRADALLAERKRLLAEIEKKRRAIENAEAETRRLTELGLERMRPILQLSQQLTGALEVLLRELLTDSQLSSRARKEVDRIRVFLTVQGVLDPSFEPHARREAHAPHDAAPPWEKPPRHARRPSAPPSAPELTSAGQPAQGKRSLRDLFRSLARLVHPDRAAHDDDRERRTEVMKQVTRAYEDGDLARLIELESAWQGESALSEQDSEQRCQALERLNRELLAQLRSLTELLRDTKLELREARESCPSDSVIEAALRELEQVAEIADLLRRFRDGNAKLQDLSTGPWRDAW